MAQEDDLRALGKVMDFMRGISVIFLLINCYWFCYEAFQQWHFTLGIINKILINFQRTRQRPHRVLTRTGQGTSRAPVPLRQEIVSYHQKQTRKSRFRCHEIFDFPGHALTSAMMDLSITMDYIISPIEADPQSLASSFAYAKTIRDLGVGFEGSRIQDFFLLWNKINRSASTAVIDLFSQNAEEQGLPIFDTRIYNSVRFSRELAQGGVKGVFRCSYLPPAPALRPQTGVDEWVMEVMEKLNLKTENGV